jgi:hypothetical protein
MALTNTGPISMDNIRAELGIPTQTNFGLDTAENGGYVTINQCSGARPNNNNPAAMSEWYSYDHSAPKYLIGDIYDCSCLLSQTGVIVNPTSCTITSGWYQLVGGLRFNVTGTCQSGTPVDDITNCTNYGSCAATPCV